MLLDKLKIRGISNRNGSAAERLLQANKARDQRDWLHAADLYEKYLCEKSNDWEIHIQHGHSLKEAGYLTEAEDAYQRAIDIYPSSCESYLHIAHLQKRLGKVLSSQENFLKAFDLDPSFGEPFCELVASGYLVSKLRSRMSQNRPAPVKSLLAKQFYFDVSDLVQYFRNARIATGIQRVQIRIIEALIEKTPQEDEIGVVCYSEALRNWVQIPNEIFLELVHIASESSDVADQAWIAVRNSVHRLIQSTSAVCFPHGAYLINLGTSWWLKNYFLSVRNAKADFGIKYVPFVHDCIPALFPEHCVYELTRDFLTWVRGIFDHADFYLCNSQWTRDDLARVAYKIAGKKEIKSAVIRLDGDIRSGNEIESPGPNSIIGKSWLKSEKYVLFVSTIESRKNHFLLFDVWLRLIREIGAENVPKLICVGNKGWKADASINLLQSSDALRDKIKIVHGIADSELSTLYANCQFTVYPSLYEGWGLPVTESLCYGKPVVSSNSSSLPEAGGKHVIYFDPLSSVDLFEKLHGLLSDVHAMEQATRMAQNFRPRHWHDIAIELQEAITRALPTNADECEPEPVKFFAPDAGRIYSFAEDTSCQLVSPVANAEHFRIGDGWSTIDDFGCWMEQEDVALAISRPETVEGDSDLYLVVRGLPHASGKSVDFRIYLNDSYVSSIRVLAGAHKHCRVKIKTTDWDGNGGIVIRLQSNNFEALSLYSEGRDRRVAHGAFVYMMLVEEDDLRARYDFLEAFVNL